MPTPTPPPPPRPPAGPSSPTPPAGPPRTGTGLLDMDGLADFLGVHVQWVKQKVAARVIPFTRLPGGKLVRFTPEHVAAILAAGDEQPQHIPTRDEVAERRAAAGRRAS